MKLVLNRFKEPSSYAGIAAFLATMGVLGLSESDWQAVFNAVAAAAAALAIFMPEGRGRSAGNERK